MFLDLLPRRVAAFLSVLMVLGGISLTVWSYKQLPVVRRHAQINAPSAAAPPSVASISSTVAETGADPPRETTAPATEPAIATSLETPVVIGVDENLPDALKRSIAQVVISNTGVLTAPATAVSVTLRLDAMPAAGTPLYHTLFVPAARFDTIHPAVNAEHVRSLWRGESDVTPPYTQMAVLSNTLPSLVDLLGAPGEAVYGYGSVEEVVDTVWADGETLALLPFEQLVPELAALAVDGQNPVENENKFDATTYPFVHSIYAHLLDHGSRSQRIVEQLLIQSGGTNRRADRLSVIAMTGVTAMVRLTAQQMDQHGPAWPAEIVGPELAAADITAISNEVPFVPGCTTNTEPNNLVFCSPPEYMAALEAVGADVIGLTGNHQNDYGREDALKSLDIYADAGLPVYGGGRNKEAAFAPLYFEHNGNRLAFLGANSYGPPFAWATDNAPGSAEFDLNILSATIRSIKEKDLADIVLAELQYQESYGVEPLYDQRQNFQALIRAGADIVTGVQSHVPQAMEFEEGRLILYGLGNLFFDQMQGTTREGLIVKHTIYEGRHLSTQVLTTLIYDYGQPRWASDSERTQILERVFGASYWERLQE